MPEHKPIPRTLAELKGAPYNPRKIDERANAGLGYSMQEFGDISGFCYNLRTNHLVTGHQRKGNLPPHTPIVDYHEHTDQNGTVGYGSADVDGQRWPIRFVDWDEAKEKAANLAANNPALTGEFASDVAGLLDEVHNVLPETYEHLLLDDIVSGEFLPDGRDDSPRLTPIAISPPPVMTWVLLGIPTVRYGEIAESVERLAQSPAVICEISTSVQEPCETQEDR